MHDLTCHDFATFLKTRDVVASTTLRTAGPPILLPTAHPLDLLEMATMLSSLAAFEDVTSSGAALIGKHGLCRSVFSKLECSTLTKCVIMADSLSTWAAEMPGFQVWKDGIMVDSVDDADPKKLKQLVQAHDWGVPQKKRAAEAEAGAGERKKLRSEPASSVAAEDEGAGAAKPTLAAVEAAEAAAGRTMAKSSSGQVDDAIESDRRVFVANLPLLVASTALAPISFMPGWLGWLAALNPLTFAIEPIRAAYAGPFQWSTVVLVAPYGSLNAATCLLILTVLAFGLFLAIRPLLNRKLS
jgi:hypothetical protein